MFFFFFAKCSKGLSSSSFLFNNSCCRCFLILWIFKIAFSQIGFVTTFLSNSWRYRWKLSFSSSSCNLHLFRLFTRIFEQRINVYFPWLPLACFISNVRAFFFDFCDHHVLRYFSCFAPWKWIDICLWWVASSSPSWFFLCYRLVHFSHLLLLIFNDRIINDLWNWHTNWLTWDGIKNVFVLWCHLRFHNVCIFRKSINNNTFSHLNFGVLLSKGHNVLRKMWTQPIIFDCWNLNFGNGI